MEEKDIGDPDMLSLFRNGSLDLSTDFVSYSPIGVV